MRELKIGRKDIKYVVVAELSTLLRQNTLQSMKKYREDWIRPTV